MRQMYKCGKHQTAISESTLPPLALQLLIVVLICWLAAKWLALRRSCIMQQAPACLPQQATWSVE
jgi:hypothetical protein